VRVDFAWLRGTVYPFNAPTTVSFEWGQTTNYGNEKPADQSPVNGSGSEVVSAILTELMPGTVYHYRVKAVSCGITNYGNDIEFETPLCPETITKNHTDLSVAPLSKQITYYVVKSNLSGTDKCWLQQNLGATYRPYVATVSTEPYAGWYWQFNRKQGFKHDGSNRTPSGTWTTGINENSNWISTNDPCRILMGSGWRIPTYSEWNSADINGGWDNYTEAFASDLKVHAAGYLGDNNGVLYNRGSYGLYWTNAQYDNTRGRFLIINNSNSDISQGLKSAGGTIRCIKD